MKRGIYRLALFVCELFISVNLLADNQNSLQTATILGSKYYIYEAKKGDTLFGISRNFGWDDSYIQKLNPEVVSPLKKGQRILYPVDSLSTSLINDTSNDSYGCSNPNFYVIQENDDIVGLSKRFDISVSALLIENPGLTLDSFKSGNRIKIPEKGSGLKSQIVSIDELIIKSFGWHTVSDNESWTDIANKEIIDINVLKAANPDINMPKNKQIVVVPAVENIKEERETIVRDDRESTKVGLKEIYDEIHKVVKSSDDVLKIAIIVESPTAKKDIDFVRGFLTGLKVLGEDSYKVKLKVIDGTNSPDVIINDLDEFKPNIAFLTYDKSIPSFYSDYSAVSRTPIVNSFDVKNEEYKNNPYFIQILAPSDSFNEDVASNAFNKYGDYKLLFIGNPDSSDQLAQELKKKWGKSNYTNITDLVGYPTSSENNDKYMVYAYTTKKSEVEKLLKDVVSIQEDSPLTDIFVFGRPNWIVFDQSLSELLGKANTVIPSRFYLDEQSISAKTFYQNYKSIYNRAPVKSLPLYAGVGYDLSNYFVTALYKASFDINSIKPSVNTLQSGFSFIRENNWTGLINPEVYFVSFNHFGTTEKITIK